MNTTTLNMTTLDGGVIIKKGTAPAPPSGGEWRYFDVREIDDATKEGFLALSQVCRCLVLGADLILPPLLATKYGVTIPNVYSVAIAFDLKMRSAQGVSTMEEELSKFGMLDILLAVEITKEEFYNLD